MDALKQTQTEPAVIVRQLGHRDYEPVWREMQQFTDQRGPDTKDELWVVEHPPVFTVGQAGDMAHVLNSGDIPVIHVDRGGQVTYHGPGQVVIYPLLDISRSKMGIRCLVDQLEESVIQLLAHHDVVGERKEKAPGVYVAGEKIASLGLRVRKGRTFHGLAMNVDMDLSPFKRINPCGYQGLNMTQLVTHDPGCEWQQVATDLTEIITQRLGLQMIQ